MDENQLAILMEKIKQAQMQAPFSPEAGAFAAMQNFPMDIPAPPAQGESQNWLRQFVNPDRRLGSAGRGLPATTVGVRA